MKPHRVAALVNAAVDDCHAAFPTREIRIALSSSLPEVLADDAWIQKVLGQPARQRRQILPAEQPIFVSADPQGDMLAISVADRGAGIDPLEQAMVFDKFYRGQGQRSRVTGTGMGLAICRAIVAAHGGAIGVTSQIGLGSVFTFTLPTVRPT